MGRLPRAHTRPCKGRKRGIVAKIGQPLSPHSKLETQETGSELRHRCAVVNRSGNCGKETPQVVSQGRTFGI